MSRDLTETLLQKRFDALHKVLEATSTNQKAAEDAINALNVLRAGLARDVWDLSESVKRTMKELAPEAAHTAAGLLQKDFKGADEAARNAAQHYERASRFLKWRLVGVILLAQTILLVGVWLVARFTIPSIDEIEARRQEIRQMAQQVNILESRGGRLQLEECKDAKGRERVCFRTDEVKGERPFQRPNDAKTFRVPWGH